MRGMESETKTCQNCKNSFSIEREDFDFYEKMNVPPPTWCALCRKIRRMAWRNERTLYKATCGMCKKTMFSQYAPESPFPVYCRECFVSDKWSTFEYAQEIDWNKPFLQQIHELQQKVPRVALMHLRTNINSEYAHYIAEAKNTSLSFSVARSENIMYSRAIDDSRDCIDCSDLQFGELCYENIQSDNNNHCRYVYSCTKCLSSDFLFDCVNCQDCFMSSNLRNKQYVFRNERCSKEEYQKKIGEINFGNYDTIKALKEEYKKLRESAIHKYGDILNAKGCTGNNIADSKNCKVCFDVMESENLKFCDRTGGPKDSYDITGAITGELMYEHQSCGYNGYAILFGIISDSLRESYYTDYCMSSVHLFGCAGLRNQEYCILNKKYSKEEYEALVPKIIQHMNEMPYIDVQGRIYTYGEYFPVDFSVFAYNESLAQEYFPLNKEEATSRGYRWRDMEKKGHTITLTPDNLPRDIQRVQDKILTEVIGCEHEGTCNEKCTEAFKITPQELQFYRQMQIPIPHLCPNCRHYERSAIRNPLFLWHRRCMCEQNGHGHDAICSNEFDTSYAPERPEKIYCETCYQQEIS